MFSRDECRRREWRIDIETLLLTTYVKREAVGMIPLRGYTACVRVAIAAANARQNSHEERTPLYGVLYVIHHTVAST